MTEEPPSGEEAAIAEVSELPEKCTRQSVLIAALRPKSRSNQQKDGRFTVGNAFLITGHPEKTAHLEKTADTKCYLCKCVYINTYISFIFWTELRLCRMNFASRSRHLSLFAQRTETFINILMYRC